jgi:hypothetical protein
MINELGPPVGDPVPSWTARTGPTTLTLSGRYCRLERLADRHAEELFAADQLEDSGARLGLPRHVRGRSGARLGLPRRVLGFPGLPTPLRRKAAQPTRLGRL